MHTPTSLDPAYFEGGVIFVNDLPYSGGEATPIAKVEGQRPFPVKLFTDIDTSTRCLPDHPPCQQNKHLHPVTVHVHGGLLPVPLIELVKNVHPVQTMGH